SPSPARPRRGPARASFQFQAGLSRRSKRPLAAPSRLGVHTPKIAVTNKIRDASRSRVGPSPAGAQTSSEHGLPRMRRNTDCMPEALLEIRGLRRVFRGRHGQPDHVAVDGVSFTLDAGGSLGIVGESGSGKTTTVSMIAGLVQPTAGTIVVNGRTRTPGRVHARERRRRAREVQLVFQDPYASLD